jgi:Gas vesicle synthesis protein GvpL/GvpF
VAETGRYLYAVCRGLELSDLEGVSGLDGSPLELVHDEGLVAVVSDVDLDEYGEEGLRRNLEDLGWLEHAARGHDAVVQAAARVVPTAPLRLATICFDDNAVHERLREWYGDLVRVLDRIEGRLELSVKVLAAPGPAAQPRQVAAASTPGAGADYLRQKQSESRARVDEEAAAADAAARVHDELASVSVASRLLPAQDPRLTGHEGTMVLNGAYLVEAEEVGAFTTLAHRLADQLEAGLTLDCRGPWPPYSFAVLDQP